MATDIAARGIDIADVSHVINFDCPHIADDYIHRVGRTGRASAIGDAFTFVSDEEQSNLRTIERAINKRLPRITLPDFDYSQKAAQNLEIPIAQRIAAIRAEKARARARQQAAPQYGSRSVSQGAPHGAPHHGQPQAPRTHGAQFQEPRGRPQGGPQNGQQGGHGSQGQRSHYDAATIGGARSGGHGGGGGGGGGQANSGHGFQGQTPRQPGGGRGGKFSNRPKGRFSGPVGPR